MLYLILRSLAYAFGCIIGLSELDLEMPRHSKQKQSFVIYLPCIVVFIIDLDTTTTTTTTTTTIIIIIISMPNPFPWNKLGSNQFNECKTTK